MMKSTFIRMLIFYTILIQILGIFIKLVSPFNQKAKLWLKGRRDQDIFIKSAIQKWTNNPIVWIHAASYGEFEMSRPIINGLLNSNKQYRFVVSFFSPSGYENIDLDKDIFLKIYLPLDLKKNHEVLLSLIKPKAIIFIKYEFWYNLLQILNRKKIPYFYTSLHLNQSSYLFKKPFSSLKRLLLKARKIYCHNPKSFEILSNNGFKNIEMFGDTRIEQSINNTIISKELIHWKNNTLKTIAFGSLTQKEEEDVIKLINQNEDFNYIVAPHDVDLGKMKDLRKKITSSVNFLSELNQNKTSERVLIVDTYGDLKYLYRHADIAYIGAGFEKGPHNVLEPLVYNIPVFCGRNIHKFPMAQYLKSENLLMVLESQTEFGKIVEYVKTTDLTSFAKRSQLFFKKSRTKIDVLINEINSL